VSQKQPAIVRILRNTASLLNAICARGEEWSLTHNWEPILHDPDDEPLAQLARESGAPVIITYNTRHLQPAALLGIQVMKPIEFLRILRQ
jgi:predicted nucleic acid-binding protein